MVKETAGGRPQRVCNRPSRFLDGGGDSGHQRHKPYARKVQSVVKTRWLCSKAKELGCQVTFCSARNMMAHVSTVHKGRRPFQCKSCDAAFGHGCSLTTHVRAVHEKRRDLA